MPMNATLIQRLMRRVWMCPMSGCWIWMGAICGKGYGYMSFNSTMMMTHRAMFALKNGPIPQGKMVLHKCDVMPCINPEHLFLGTNTENMRDMVSKGRCTSTLTRESVSEIRRKYQRGLIKQIDLATEFGVGQSTISRTILNKCWCE